VYLARGEPAPAETALRKALALQPDLVDSYLTLGELYVKSGKYDQALAELNTALGRNPSNLSALMLSGSVHEVKGDIPRAQVAYEKVLAVAPRFAPAANNLAYLYSEHGGDQEKALQLAQTAKEVAPDDPRISDTLGWILYKRGVYQRALGELQESASKLADNPEVQYHLGLTYYKLGNMAGAKQALGKALKLRSRFPGSEEARQVLAGLK
jgi:Flp pilus assembly protein TadD